MPATEPGPLGTFSAYPAQPVPTRSEAGAAAALDEGAADVMAGALEELAELAEALLLEASVAGPVEHAATPKIATALRPVAASALR
jgi:hypothetical protein